MEKKTNYHYQIDGVSVGFLGLLVKMHLRPNFVTDGLEQVSVSEIDKRSLKGLLRCLSLCYNNNDI